MNYISHYYLFKKNANAEMTLGLVLPDMTRAANKKFRLKKFKNLTKQDEFYNLKYGINKHFETDIIFHDAAFFKIHVAKLKTQILDLQLIENNKYAYFLAHIAFEMILDRCLIKKEETEANNFYSKIMQVETARIKLFLVENNFEKYESELQQFLQYFNTKKYLLKYLIDEKMAYALGRVFNYATKIEVDWTTNKKMHTFILSSEKYLEQQIDDIFSYMNEKLNLIF